MGTLKTAARLGRYEGSLTTSVAPSGLIVSVSDLKTYLRIDHTEHDSLLRSLIETATTAIENMTGRDFIQRTRVWTFDDLAGDIIRLPRSPVQSITSIQYVDSNGDSQTEATTVYGLDNGQIPALVYLKDGQDWSSTRGGHNDVTVTFVTGYASTGASPPTMDDIPEPIKQIIKMSVSDMYENTESQTALAFTYKANPTVQMLAAEYVIHWQ